MSDAASPLVNFIQLWICGAFYMKLLPNASLPAFVASFIYLLSGLSELFCLEL
jgi:hypothetical protein